MEIDISASQERHPNFCPDKPSCKIIHPRVSFVYHHQTADDKNHLSFPQKTYQPKDSDRFTRRHTQRPRTRFLDPHLQEHCLNFRWFISYTVLRLIVKDGKECLWWVLCLSSCPWPVKLLLSSSCHFNFTAADGWTEGRWNRQPPTHEWVIVQSPNKLAKRHTQSWWITGRPFLLLLPTSVTGMAQKEILPPDNGAQCERYP